MSVNSKHSAGKIDKPVKRAKRKKLEESEDMDSSEEELDLTKECHPIGYYLNDRAEMINQMFSVIKGNKLKAMLPPLLKDCDLDFLKLKCLDQLLGMSEKRISRILDGEVLETSSESDIETNDYESDEKKTSSYSTSNRSDESTEEEFQNENEKRLKRKKKKKDNTLEDDKAGKNPQNDLNPPEQGKTLLEILELEMRARAIRALLKQNEITQDGSGSDIKTSESKENGIKEISHEVVDLTGCEDDEITVPQQKAITEEAVVHEKISTFEEKLDKSKASRGNQDEEKSKRMQAELGLQNRLFKKIYRIKRNRPGNEQEEQEVKPDACEAPEEGELSSSEDGLLTKQEPESQPKIVIPSAEEHEILDYESNTDTEGKTQNEVDSGNCMTENTAESYSKLDSGDAAKNTQESEDDILDKPECLNAENESDIPKIDSPVSSPVLEESEAAGVAEETSWRERWLRKDGVQKLVKSSKIYAKVKKRIAEKSQRSKEDVSLPSEAKSVSDSSKKLEIIEGSIKEYEKLVGKTVQPSETAFKEASTPKRTDVDSENNATDIQSVTDVQSSTNNS